MKVDFRQSFVRDPKKIKDRAVLDKIKQAIERVEVVAGELAERSGHVGSIVVFDEKRVRVCPLPIGGQRP